jgi:hypothetical protein
MLRGMWNTISRARRRLGGEGIAAAAPTTPVPLEPATPIRIEDTVITFGHAEIDRLRHALTTALGDEVSEPNSPARIEAALTLLLSRNEAPGRPCVVRRPACVSTPESWEIHLEGAEVGSAIAVRDAGRSGRFGT